MTPKQIAAFAIGPIGGAFLGLVTLPVITWFFPQEDVGRFAMLQVAIGFSTTIFSLGLDQAYVREFHETENKPGLLKIAMLPGLIILIIALMVLMSAGGALAGWLFELPQAHLSLLIALALITSYISRFLSLVLRMRERGLAFSMSQILPKLFLLSIIGVYVFVGVDRDLTNLVLANSAVISFVCVIYAWNTRREWLEGIRAKLDIDRLKSMLRFGLPLILGGLAFWGLTTVDKIFLKMLSSFEELGIYSVAVSFAGAAVILQSVFSTVWAPTVYRWASIGQGLENILKVRRYILALVVLGFSLMGLFSWVITLFLPVEYAAVQWVVVSCVAYPLLYTLSETTVVGIGISRRSSLAMLAAVISFAVNIVGNWFLIPIFGAAGAAVSTCISFLFFFVLRTEFSIFAWKQTPRLLMYIYTVISVLGAVLFTLWGENLNILMRFYWVLVLVSWIIVFRDEIKEMFDFIQKTTFKKITA